MSFVDFEIQARLKARRMTIHRLSEARTEIEGDAVRLERKESRGDPGLETQKQLTSRLDPEALSNHTPTED